MARKKVKSSQLDLTAFATGGTRAMVKTATRQLFMNFPGGGSGDFGNIVLGRGSVGAVDCDSNQLTNVATPTTGTAAANRNYVDSAVSGSSTLGTNWTLVERAFNVNYFPSGSLYVAVSVRISYSGSAGVILSINGNHIQSLNFPSNDFGGIFYLFGIVPPGQFYALIPSGAGVNITSVHELL